MELHAFSPAWGKWLLTTKSQTCNTGTTTLYNCANLPPESEGKPPRHSLLRGILEELRMPLSRLWRGGLPLDYRPGRSDLLVLHHNSLLNELTPFRPADGRVLLALFRLCGEPR
ncbi:hypothetical protein QQF64_020514 [Cirrhinus molitorella]|uniref:Uncharacterized protein n=1 Tax=Cirrhinus molitorella TaxID=172907 RepID=A0ABR3LCT3_9TELE